MPTLSDEYSFLPWLRRPEQVKVLRLWGVGREERVMSGGADKRANSDNAEKRTLIRNPRILLATNPLAVLTSLVGFHENPIISLQCP